MALSQAAQNWLATVNSGLSPTAVTALTSAANTSPYLEGMLEAAAVQGVRFALTSTGGVSATGDTVTLNSQMQPGGSSGLAPNVFATGIAHELAHILLPAPGNPPRNAPALAAAIGGTWEG